MSSFTRYTKHTYSVLIARNNSQRQFIFYSTAYIALHHAAAFNYNTNNLSLLNSECWIVFITANKNKKNLQSHNFLAIDFIYTPTNTKTPTAFYVICVLDHLKHEIDYYIERINFKPTRTNIWNLITTR